MGTGEHPDDPESPTGWEQLGDSLADEGRLSEVEEAFRHIFDGSGQRDRELSYTSGIVELSLAEVILVGGDPGRLRARSTYFCIRYGR